MFDENNLNEKEYDEELYSEATTIMSNVSVILYNHRHKAILYALSMIIMRIIKEGFGKQDANEVLKIYTDHALEECDEYFKVRADEDELP